MLWNSTDDGSAVAREGSNSGSEQGAAQPPPLEGFGGSEQGAGQPPPLQGFGAIEKFGAIGKRTAFPNFESIVDPERDGVELGLVEHLDGKKCFSVFLVRPKNTCFCVFLGQPLYPRW